MLTNELTAPRILIVEDDCNHVELIQRSFADDLEEYQLEIVDTIARAKQATKQNPPCLVLTDYRLPDGEGIELVASAGQWPVIIMTSQGNEQLAVEVIKRGAQDYIVKSPESLAIMAHIVLRALKSWALLQEKRQTDEAVRRGKRDWERTFDAVPDLISIIDSHRTILRVNKAMAARCGLSVDKMIGRKCYEMVHGVETIPAFCPGLALGKDGLIHNHEIEEKRLNGTFDITVSPLIDEDGQVTSFVHIMRDITERKAVQEEKLALERQFQQTQKLESLGVLAGGIAHDFNNILAVILCNCSLLKQQPQMGNELIPEIAIAAERAADLCRRMLIYAGKAQFIPTRIKMAELVSEMCKMLRATISQKISLHSDLAEELPVITGDASQLRQIVMNLIINAAEAIGEEQGEIKVALRQTEIGAQGGDVDFFSVAIPAGSYLCLEITDNGCGMDLEIQRRIFEPFYTTKFTGRGLGMSAVLGIITTHNGMFQLHSQPGQGTAFKIYLPVQNSPSTGQSQAEGSIPAWRGSGTILLAEDENQLREIAKALIEHLGFAVIEAANGQAALQLYREHAAAIDLVVTDIDMPIMNGYELFNALKRIDRALPIILSSGFGDLCVTEQITEGEVSGYLSKPYSFDQLRNVLKSLSPPEGDQSRALYGES